MGLLKVEHPEIAAQWHPVKNPDLSIDTIKSSYRKHVWWQCELGHEWKSVLRSRVQQGSGCPYCAGKKIWAGYNDLATLAPDLAAQWHPEKNGDLLPTQVSPGSHKKNWWICELGHEWEASPDNRSRQNQGCPYCAGKKIREGYNDLSTLHPEIAAQWNLDKNGDTIPEMVSPGSHKKYWWICEDGHEWEASVKNRTSRGSGCPYCSGHRVIPGETDLEAKGSRLVAQWHPTKNGVKKASDFTEQSHYKAWWTCEKGHEWQAVISGRTEGRECPHCVDSSSKGERELLKFIEDTLSASGLNVDVVSGSRGIIKPYELDIYIPEKKIAIEYNGIYWHSDAAGRGRSYHYDKWRKCKDLGIQLITIWEDEWRDKREIVESMLLHKLGVSPTQKVYARDCIVREVMSRESKEFLDKNHIQGGSSGTLHLGIYDERTDTLVAVSVWTKEKDTLLLDRYATAIPVVGGMGKVLKQAQIRGRGLGCRRIVTFADHCVSDGGLYESLGFTDDGILPPDYKYVVNGERIHKFNYRLERFRKDPDLVYIPGKTESELALVNGLPRLYDCGKTRYVLEL